MLKDKRLTVCYNANELNLKKPSRTKKVDIYMVRLRSWLRFFPRKVDFVGLLALALTLGWLMSLNVLNDRHLLPLQAESDHIVVFTARWCASCSTLVPSVENVAKRLAIPFIKIDVDDTKATAQARQFGLEIPRSDLPQAYYIQSSGKQTLVLNGKLYRPNQAQQVDTDLDTKIKQIR